MSTIFSIKSTAHPSIKLALEVVADRDTKALLQELIECLFSNNIKTFDVAHEPDDTHVTLTLHSARKRVVQLEEGTTTELFTPEIVKFTVNPQGTLTFDETAAPTEVTEFIRNRYVWKNITPNSRIEFFDLNCSAKVMGLMGLIPLAWNRSISRFALDNITFSNSCQPIDYTFASVTQIVENDQKRKDVQQLLRSLFEYIECMNHSTTPDQTEVNIQTPRKSKGIVSLSDKTRFTVDKEGSVQFIKNYAPSFLFDISSWEITRLHVAVSQFNPMLNIIENPENRALMLRFLQHLFPNVKLQIKVTEGDAYNIRILYPMEKCEPVKFGNSTHFFLHPYEINCTLDKDGTLTFKEDSAPFKAPEALSWQTVYVSNGKIFLCYSNRAYAEEINLG